MVGYGWGANGLMQTYFARLNTNPYITTQDTLNPPPPTSHSYSFDPFGNVVMRHGTYNVNGSVPPDSPNYNSTYYDDLVFYDAYGNRISDLYYWTMTRMSR